MSSTTIQQVSDELFAADADHGVALALVVVHDGEVVHQRYGVQPTSAFAEGGPVTAATPLISWSMAKSVVHAAVGVLVGDRAIDLHAPAPVAQWAGTAKASITTLDLLEMRPGLRWVEDYVDSGISNCLQMLFDSGAADVARYAADLPLDDPPGTVWNYSSGTTNIICRILGDIVGGGEQGMHDFLDQRLFGPAGMASAAPRFDAAGTFIGSSYVYATALDFARFGELYRGDGIAADGRRVLPAGWADHASTFVAADPVNGLHYGRHWWMFPQFPGSMAACGYEGQHILVVPDRRLTVVSLNKTPADRIGLLRARLIRLVEAFPACPG